MRAPNAAAPTNGDLIAHPRANAWDQPATTQPPLDDAVISLTNLSVSYGDFQALRDVSIDIPPGATGLVGRNGAGKSTLMKVLLGLLRPTAGTGHVLDTDILAPGETLRRAVGYMPENDAFVLGMRGLEQVALAGELCGLSSRDAIRRAHEVLMYVGLGEARYRTAEEYSTGMRQRLKLAVALVHDPQLLLLDEPTVGLDPPGAQRMLDLLEDLTHRHGKSLVVSTHLLGDIEHTCDTVVIIERGSLIASGPLSQILRENSCHFLLRWNGNGENFVDALRREGGELLKSESIAGKVLSSRDGEARIAMPANYDTTRIFEIAHQHGVRLRTLEQDHADLSELYHRMLIKGTARDA